MRYFGKEWYRNRYNNENVVETEKYFEYERKHLPEWYNEKFSIHDSKIIDVKYNDSLLVLTLIYDTYDHPEYQIKFYNPIILENCQLKDSWCISDEIYIDNSLCEYHLMCDVNVNGRYGNLYYFTVRCSKIEISLNNQNCLIEPD